MACACGIEHKYTCPACGAHTCSVECSKKHKSSTGCSGILDPTRYVPRGELLTATGLDRDYNFLQRIGRDIHVEAPEFKRRARDYTRNNVKVRSMPPQMSRAKQNRSGWNRTKQCYLWTIELRKELTKGGEISHVPDTQTIVEITGQEAATLIDADGKKVPLRGDQTLAEALKDQVIVEFPTIYLGVVEESSENDSETESSASSDESSSDESEDDAPEEESSKIPVEGDTDERIPSVIYPNPTERAVEPTEATVETVVPKAAGSESKCTVVESIEPVEISNPVQTSPQGDTELASILEEAEAALHAEEPETLKNTLIEEL